MTTVAVAGRLDEPDLAGAAAALLRYLASCAIQVRQWPAEADAVLVLADGPCPDELAEALLGRAAAGVPVLLAGPTAYAWRDCDPLTEAAGVLPGNRTPRHETRVRPSTAGQLGRRLDPELLVVDGWPVPDKVMDDVAALATAYVGLAEHPVLTWRDTRVGVCTLGTTAQALGDPRLHRLVHRWLRHALGRREGPDVRVGMLGYGAIGAEHAAAIAAVDGLRLAAVCDRNPARVDAARALAPGVQAYADADALIDGDDVDLVVVSTPPNTHAQWALRALRAGKHVVVEKPFCLTTTEADELLAAAGDRVLAVYQNRRWDADYLAVRAAVRSGALGQVFHAETFVGGYGHPCNYWHSDAEVSGGAIYDWGSHYLDWLLDLFAADVETVTSVEHKRVWHDVTNADQSRVTLRFAGGAEATFIHSDLAAALKPKWFLLGTEGALVGQWRQEAVLSRDPVGNLVEDRLTPAESPALLSLHRPDGAVTTLTLPRPPLHPFHRELADRLHTGEPMSLSPEGSRRGVAVMEAATASARAGGAPVRPR